MANMEVEMFFAVLATLVSTRFV